MVDQLLQTMLTDDVVLDTVGGGLPLEVEKTVIVVVSRLPTWVDHTVAVTLVILRFYTAAYFQNFNNQTAIIPWPYHVLKRLRLVLLVAILRNITILGQRILASLHEFLLLLGSLLEGIRKPPRWKVAVHFGSCWLLWLIGQAFALSLVVLVIIANFFLDSRLGALGGHRVLLLALLRMNLESVVR